jgi:hypothetical protein
MIKFDNLAFSLCCGVDDREFDAGKVCSAHSL